MHKSATHQMGITVNPGVVSGFKEQLYYDPSKLRTVFVKETKEEVQVTDFVLVSSMRSLNARIIVAQRSGAQACSSHSFCSQVGANR